MSDKEFETNQAEILSFLKKNPDLQEKLSKNLTVVSSSSAKSEHANKIAKDNTLADDFWIVKMEERTLLDFQINLINQIQKFMKTPGKHSTQAVESLQSQLNKIVKQITTVRKQIIIIKKSINFSNVSKDMKKTLKLLEKHIKQDKSDLLRLESKIKNHSSQT